MAPQPRDAPSCCLCWGLVLGRLGSPRCRVSQMPNRWVSEGSGGVPGAGVGGSHHTHPSTGQALNKGSVGGTRLSVESGGITLEGWGHGPCAQAPHVASPRPQVPSAAASALGLAASHPAHLAARVAPGTGSLASVDKSGAALCSAGPKEWTSPWERGQGPLELLPGVGWPGGLPGTTTDEWVGQTPSAPPTHTHTHSSTCFTCLADASHTQNNGPAD